MKREKRSEETKMALSQRVILFMCKSSVRARVFVCVCVRKIPLRLIRYFGSAVGRPFYSLDYVSPFNVCTHCIRTLFFYWFFVVVVVLSSTCAAHSESCSIFIYFFLIFFFCFRIAGLLIVTTKCEIIFRVRARINQPNTRTTIRTDRIFLWVITNDTATNNFAAFVRCQRICQHKHE